MAFCANCGAPVEGRFCAKCGMSAPASPAPAAAAGSGAQAPYQASANPQQGGPAGNAYANPGAGAYGQAYGNAPGYAAAPAAAQTSGMSENVASALCYVLGLITGILFLVLAPYNQNKTVRFHAFQSIFFHVACIVAWIATFALSMIPFFGLIMLLVDVFLWLGAIVLWVVLIVKAYQNSRLMLPVIGALAEQQANNS